MTTQELKQKWEAGFSYNDYKVLMDELVKEGKTSGPQQSEALTNYSRMNDQRMKRLDKKAHLDEELISKLRSLSGNYGWLVLTEAWCGDAANNIPLMNKMAEQTPNIQLRFLLRDEHPGLMDEFLTDGTRAIPLLIAINLDNFEVVGTWGPRPEPAQEMVRTYKEQQHISRKELSENIQKWYLQDRHHTIEQEFKYLLPKWEERIFRTEPVAVQ